MSDLGREGGEDPSPQGVRLACPSRPEGFRPAPLTLAELDVAALARVAVNPNLVGRLLAGWTPREAWVAVLAGRHPADLDGRLARAAADLDRRQLAARLVRLGVRVCWRETPDFPARLARDPRGPSVLFVQGRRDLLHAGPVVAVVGSRAATHYGLEVANWFGEALGAAGVVVAGGLGRGVEAAAQAGALRSKGPGPLAVVGGGLGRPLAGEELRQQRAVVERGAVVTELAPGVPERPWTLALRCRSLVGLSEVVLVVEAGERSGALRSVREARRQGVPVLVVPGPVTSPANRGGHRLVAAGQAALAFEPADVLATLGQDRGRPHEPAGKKARQPLAGLSSAAQAVAGRLGGDPVSVDWLVAVTGLSLAEVVVALQELAGAGWALATAGLWRCGPPG